MLANLSQPLTNVLFKIKSAARWFYENYPKFGKHEFGRAKFQWWHFDEIYLVCLFKSLFKKVLMMWRHFRMLPRRRRQHGDARCQFHQRSTYKIFVRTSFRQLFLVMVWLWQKNCTKNVDEINRRCQFHQHFLFAFFVQKCFMLLLSTYSLAL